MRFATSHWACQRENYSLLQERLRVHLRRYGIVYVLVASLALVFQHAFLLGVNLTGSLPYRVFIVHKHETVHRGDYVAFRWPGGGAYARGKIFIKIAAGIPGDTVVRIDRAFYVNGRYVGTAKTQSLAGEPLAPMEAGTLPAQHYYVQAPHPDSLDSRYRMTGWIAESAIIGRAYALF